MKKAKSFTKYFSSTVKSIIAPKAKYNLLVTVLRAGDFSKKPESGFGRFSLVPNLKIQYSECADGTGLIVK